MAIKRFQFEDRLHRWKLNEVEFSSVNLLVGASGAGKTRILEALRRVCYSLYNATYVDGCRWSLELEFENLRFSWEAEISIVRREQKMQLRDHESQNIELPRFLKECIVCNGEIVVERSETEFVFNGTALPKLKGSESALALLSDEENIAPLNRLLRGVILSNKPPQGNSRSYSVRYRFGENLHELQENYPTLDALREATDVDILEKAYILQEKYPDQFESIKDDYLDIFDTVCDIKIGDLREFDTSITSEMIGLPSWPSISIAIKEHNVNGWITTYKISSGMLRTFLHLIELAISPPGSVILIDDFENSLGVNCLPQLTELILKYSTKHQFILTSHHPYVINNIPSHWWKIVTRKGSTVTVLDADSIPALKTSSAHEKFFQLMNLKEYEEGIQRSIPLINLNT